MDHIRICCKRDFFRRSLKNSRIMTFVKFCGIKGSFKHLFNQLIDNGLLEMIREGRKDDINGLLEDTLGHEFKYDSLIDPES